MDKLYKQLQAALAALQSLRMNDENRLKLYEAARNRIGTDASPNDQAPDELGCADTVSHIVKAAFGEYLTGVNIVSTRTLYQALKASPLYKEVATPIPGCIVISPTGYGGSTYVPVGHVGIVMLDGKIASNDSRDGIFRENYTIASWTRRYSERGNFFVKFYRPV